MRGYDESATARWVAEPPKRAGRSDFERDRARVLHSAGLRRLAAKTQVVTVGSADFPRTRLTHSLECAQIGRELGREIGCDPDLVDAACLAHDIGHSPFGHNGESALNELAAPCGGFEGNAQSLRLLTRLEPKVAGAGLNLTRATLDATLKYPWFSTDPVGSGGNSASPGGRPGALSPWGDDPPEPPRGPRKYGVYAEDAEVFGWIREDAPPGRPCLEAQVMDWADDVAYSVHDLEDGLHARLITIENLQSPSERTGVAQTTAVTYCGADVPVAELEEVLDSLLALDVWPTSYDGGPDALAALKNLTSELIGRFCIAAQQATLAAARDAIHPAASPAIPAVPTVPAPAADRALPAGPAVPTVPAPAADRALPAGPAVPATTTHTISTIVPASSTNPTATARPRGRLTRYAADLVVPRRQRLECALLKGIAAHYVMTRAGVVAAQARERELLAELAFAIERGAPRTLDPLLRPSWDAARTDAARRRVVIDQVACLTDTSAIAWHHRLCALFTRSCYSDLQGFSPT